MSTSITLYYANWCGHCQHFKPIWEDLKKELPALNVKHAEYEDGKDSSTIESAGVRGFPTIRITKNKKTYEYRGERTVDALIKELSNPNVSTGQPIQGGGGTGGTSIGSFPQSDIDAHYKEKYLKYKAKYMKLRAYEA